MADPLQDIFSRYGLNEPDAPDPLGDIFSQYGLTDAQPEPTLLQRTGGVLVGAARGLASALEPLQAPKDVFDAVVSGGLDPESTISERFSQLTFANYIPFGEAPTRATTGQEIIGLMGVENGFAKRWGGLAFDLLADPLIAGSALSGVGKVAKLAGAVDAGNDLTRLGRSIDTALSPVGLSRLAPEPVRRGMSQSAERVGSWLFNQRTPLQLGTGEALTIGDLLAPRSRALSFRLGEGGRVDGAARQLVAAESLGRQRGRDVEELVLENIEALETLLGEGKQGFFKRVFTAIGHQKEAGVITNGLPEVVRGHILSTAYDEVQKRGIALLDNLGADSANPLLQNFRQEARHIQSLISDEAMQAARESFEATVESVGAFARKHGFNAERAKEVYREATRIITESDSLLGFELSLYEPIKEAFFKAVVPDAGIDAVKLWEAVLGHGMTGGNVNSITRFNTSSGVKKVQDIFGVRTLGEVLQRERSFEVLSFQTFLEALPKGHLRRAYGVFQDKPTFERYVKAIEEGAIIPSNILDEANLGLEGRAGELIQGYVSAVVNPSGGQRGYVIQRDSLMRHLRENGLSAAEANRAVKDLAKSINSEKRADLIERVYTTAERYQQDLRQFRTGSPSMFNKARNVELDREALELLGEIANPIVSLFEQAQGARRTIPIKRFLSDSYKLAERHNLVSTKRGGKTSKGIPATAVTEWGAFAGKYLHPELYKQMSMAMARPDKRGGIFDNLRSLITGGYLASPNVITANTAGGIFTTAGLGVSPIDMVQSMASTLMDFAKAKRDPTYKFEDYLELRARVPLDGISLSDTELAEKSIRKISREAIGGKREFGDAVNGLIEGLRSMTGKMGLDAFGFTEVWMKTAAYRAAKGMGKSADEAAEVARLSTFDYAELPEMFRFFRDTGFLMFPGFPYFMAGRAIGTALNRPGILAVADRVDEAMGNALWGEEERVRIYASLPEWLKDEQGLAVRKRVGPRGENVYSALPLNQLLPVDTFFSNPLKAGLPFAESIATGGIFRPLLELLYAAATGTGEAPLSARYGQQVFQPGLSAGETLAQMGGFLYNNLSPGLVRKVAGYHPEAGFTGIGRELYKSLVPLPEPLAEVGYTYSEMRRGRVERDLVDSILGATVRSVQPIATGGPFMNARRNFEGARTRHSREMAVLRERARKARVYGNQEVFEQAMAEMQAKQAEFTRTWQEVMRVMSR